MKAGTTTISLRELAHGRTGDKGDRSNISVIALKPEYWEPVLAQVTQERVAACLAHRKPASVTRYVLPRLRALNFVIDGVLDGGVNGSLNLDSHGKALAFLVLDLPIEVPSALVAGSLSSRKDRP